MDGDDMARYVMCINNMRCHYIQVCGVCTVCNGIFVMCNLHSTCMMELNKHCNCITNL